MSRIVAFTYDTAIDRRILLQLRLLQQQGHEVILYANAGACATDPTDITIHRLPARPAAGLPGLVFGLLARLRRAAPGLLTQLLPLLRPLAWRLMRGDPAQSYSQLFAPALAQAPAADLIIAYDLPMLPVGVAHKQRHGGKLLYDSHELFAEQCFTPFERRMWQRCEHEAIVQADAVMTINPSVAGELARRYGLGEVSVVQNTEALPDDFPPRTPYFQQRFDLPKHSIIALFQGALTADRNLERLVEAMRYVTQPDLHLVFLGNGPLNNALHAQVAALGLGTRVHLHAAVAQAELLATSMMADFGVIPYVANCLNNQLCSPNKLYEFVIAGLPILGSDLPEIRRVITQYGIGSVGPMNDARHIAEQLDAMCLPETLARYRANGPAARAQLNWQQESHAFLRVIDKLLPRQQ